MRFSATALTALFGAIAMAAPAPQVEPTNTENVDVSGFTVRKHGEAGTTWDAVEFSITADNATDLICSASNPAYPISEVYTCGDSKYRFALLTGEENEFALRLYHELGLAFGRWGEGDIPTYCHAGGNGPTDFVCQQVSATTYVLA
ncbi:hypothetical protein B0O99DRAFT_622262 [Bisporella sp. PMI_857]|nr:hypothetical protein B0O99DRAFT_622262 [Bisporella sp. PMI_857]